MKRPKLHSLVPSGLASTLSLAVLASACDSGVKQIGQVEGETSMTTDTGGAGDGDGEACPAPQGVDIDFHITPDDGEFGQDRHLACAANTEPSETGYIVALTHCTDELGDPDIDRVISLDGDWPAPTLHDGEDALTDVRLLERSLDAVSQSAATWVVLRSKLDFQVELVALTGTELLIDPDELSPLEIRLDDAGCAPDVDSCAGLTQGLQYRIGFLIRYGDSEAVVADDTRISGFGAEQETDIVYDVLVGFASKHQCEPDGDFHELRLGLVNTNP